jgi:hypothetical protein
VSTINILARKSREGPLPYCKTGAKSEGYNQLGPLVKERGHKDPTNYILTTSTEIQDSLFKLIME